MAKLVYSFVFLSCGLLAGGFAFAIPPTQKTLPPGFAPQELGRSLSRASTTSAGVAPIGPVQSLGEWEEADAVLTQWNNPSYIKALSDNGFVKVLADGQSDVQWWQSWLTGNGVPLDHFSYYTVPTDSMWVRDYGPWWIVDGKGQVGSVDTIYNRPRPNDDKVPVYIAKQLGISNYAPGLVHTGGNYYSDGVGDAFSSTLVFQENSSISATDVLKRMFDFLGIDHYVTSQLGQGVTIQHMDTFGKLVAPDTWVFSDFPADTTFKKDADQMVALLKTLTSPYGTPYRIFRLKMTPRSGSTDYRAYINSFVSNGALFYPTYGDSIDQDVAKIYQAALPGYKIVGVDNGNTEWGDSVHCRSRNLIKIKTIFIFPKITAPKSSKDPTIVTARVVPSPGAQLAGTPKVNWSANGNASTTLSMTESNGVFTAQIPPQASGTAISFYVEASDTVGIVKRAPLNAPTHQIQFTTP